MHRWRLTCAVTFLVATITLLFPQTALAQSDGPADGDGLSPYWDPDVSRWEPILLPYAEQRNLDPDLVASVIWKESLGRPRERGPAGAVGLMGVMPFEWRPSAEELENPWTNLFWGTRALAHTIRDAQGDVYYALAAYNGGWGKAQAAAPRRYAADVLGDYVRAVAMRHGLPTDGEWVAVFAIEETPGPDTITVLGPQRPLARYTERCWVQANIPAVPVGALPHAHVITFVDEQGMECRVNVWLIAGDGAPLTSPAASTTFSYQPLATEMVYRMQGPVAPFLPLKGIP
jgi:hypothetical protein